MIVIVGHGSREAESNREFEDFVRRFAARRTESVSYGYIELAEPSIEEAIRAAAMKASHVKVVPLFLFASGHVKSEIPEIIERVRPDFPGVEFELKAHIGVDRRLLAAALDRTPKVLDAGLIVVGRGSSHPEANGDFYKYARLFAEAYGARFLLPCFIGITWPTVPETLEVAAKSGVRDFVVVPHLLFRGVLADRLRDQVAAFRSDVNFTVAPHIGIDERIFDILDERIDGRS